MLDGLRFSPYHLHDLFDSSSHSKLFPASSTPHHVRQTSIRSHYTLPLVRSPFAHCKRMLTTTRQLEPLHEYRRGDGPRVAADVHLDEHQGVFRTLPSIPSNADDDCRNDWTTAVRCSRPQASSSPMRPSSPFTSVRRSFHSDTTAHPFQAQCHSRSNTNSISTALPAYNPATSSSPIALSPEGAISRISPSSRPSSPLNRNQRSSSSRLPAGIMLISGVSRAGACPRRVRPCSRKGRRLFRFGLSGMERSIRTG